MAYRLVLSSFLIFGIATANVNAQSSSCDDDIRSAVWQVISKYDSFSLDWKCKEKLELVRFRFGASSAYIIRALGSGLCGATGNCPTWVVARVAGRYRRILHAGSVIETTEINYRLGKMYPDLGFRGRIGAGDHYLGKFRFVGTRYRLESCVYETYTTDGKKHVRKAPPEYCR